MKKNRKGSDTRRSSKPAASAALLDLPVAKNDEVVIDIIGMNHDGEGVGRADGYTLFVQGALPGEKARVKVLKTKKQYGYAKRWSWSSRARTASRPRARSTTNAAAPAQHMNYAGQLEWKRQLVVDNLERIGKSRVVREAEGAGETRGGDERSGTDGGGTLRILKPMGRILPCPALIQIKRDPRAADTRYERALALPQQVPGADRRNGRWPGRRFLRPRRPPDRGYGDVPYPTRAER